MAKNTKTMGIIPRGYGLAFNTKERTIILSPSRFAEGIAMILPRSILKENWEANSSYKFSELEKMVLKKKGSLNLIRKEGIISITDGGTVSFGIVKSRKHGGRKGSDKHRNPVTYRVGIKGIQLRDGEISNLYDVTCGCEDFSYSKIKDESRSFAVACTHIAALIQAYKMRDYINLEDRIKHCKPLLDGEIAIPFNLVERPELVIKELEMRYIEGKKLFDIDLKLFEEDIITPAFKRGIEKGIVTFNCIKDCENYPENIRYWVNLLTYWISEFGGKRKGIVLEDDGKCYWNFEMDNFDLRILPRENKVEVMKVIYDIENVDNLEISIDPMRKRKRACFIKQIKNRRDLEELLNQFCPTRLFLGEKEFLKSRGIGQRGAL